MPWWGWLVAGAALLAVEMFIVDVQFYLVFLGLAAALVGLAGLFGIDLPTWAQYLAFAVLALVTMISFRRRLYRLVRERTGAVEERLTVGDRVSIPQHLPPQDSCRVQYAGTTWTARNIDEQPIAAGTEAVIASIDGLTLQVRAAHRP